MTQLNNTLGDDELLRYSRQILLDAWDIESQQALKCSHAVIVGAGGLGCPVAQVLTRAGIGKLTLVDYDAIELSNLQRQFLFDERHLGLSKSQVAKQMLEQQNPFVQVIALNEKITAENGLACLSKLSQVDLVIDCTDNFAVRDTLNRVCRAQNLPLLSLSAIAEVGQIALYTAQTGCYHCVFGGEAGDELTCATSGVLASTVAIIGSLGAQVALQWLGQQKNTIANQLLIWQGQTMQLKHLAFLADERCPVCSHHNK